MVTRTSPGNRHKLETELTLVKDHSLSSAVLCEAPKVEGQPKQLVWYCQKSPACVPADRLFFIMFSSLLQGLTYFCPTQLHRVSPRDRRPLLSKPYTRPRHQCGVTGLPHSFWALACCSEASRSSRKAHYSSRHAHIPRCSHSPVKVLNQWKKEVSSNRIELIWARSQFHLRLTLSKRKMKSRHKMQHPNLPLYRTPSRLQVPCSHPTVSHCLLVGLQLLVSRLLDSLPTSDPLTHLNISVQYSSVLLG